MITESVYWIMLLLAGGLLGLVYFGGLWLTIRQLTHWKNPGLVMMLSLLLRVLVVVAGFYWLTDGQWRELLASLSGFVIVRMLMVRHYRPALPLKPVTR